MVYLYEESLLIRDQISSMLLSVSPILLWNSYVPQSPLILFRHCHCLSHFQIHPTGKVQFGFIVLMFSMRRLIPLKRSWTGCCVFYDTALRTMCSNCIFQIVVFFDFGNCRFWDFFFFNSNFPPFAVVWCPGKQSHWCIRNCVLPDSSVMSFSFPVTASFTNIVSPHSAN